jgi:hypothetical protein
MEALAIGTFQSFREASRYARMIRSDSLSGAVITEGVTPVIISGENLSIMQTGKTVEEYIAFFLANFDDGAMITLPAEIVAEVDMDKDASRETEVGVDADTDEGISHETKIGVETETEENILREIEAGAKTEFEEIISREKEKIVPLQTPALHEPEQKQQPIGLQPAIQDRRVTPEELKRELERKAAEAMEQREEASSPKSRNEVLKGRERERQEKIRQRELELKERQRKREAELKQREQEREERVRIQERIRKEKLK